MVNNEFLETIATVQRALGNVGITITEFQEKAVEWAQLTQKTFFEPDRPETSGTSENSNSRSDLEIYGGKGNKHICSFKNGKFIFYTPDEEIQQQTINLDDLNTINLDDFIGEK